VLKIFYLGSGKIKMLRAAVVNQSINQSTFISGTRPIIKFRVNNIGGDGTSYFDVKYNNYNNNI